jgi:hypothetical protein
MSYTNLNNPANYQLQSFGQDGMRTISTTQAYVEGEYYRVLVATEDSTLSATSMVGDDLASIDVYAGTTIYGLFTAVTVTAGEVTAYLAGRTNIDDVWAYIRAYGEANGATIEGEDCAKAAISPLLDKYYAQASLVMVPSLYKTSIVYSERPLSTDGQLTFSRASSATRVASNGYIEKVRTNLALYSEDLTDAVYTKTNVTITANSEIAPDGTLTADTITATSTLGLTQGVVTVTSGLVYTMSGWLKRKTGTGLINLRGVSNTNTPITITNDWVRYSVSLTATDTTGRYGVRLDVSGDEVYAWGFQLEVGDIMTDYIGPTTSAAVSVGPVANVPRLDYLGSSCPRLLLEPQRTNSFIQSQSFGGSEWTKSNASVTGNNATSPEGIQNASLLTISAAVGNIYENVGGSGNFTFSVFAKYVDMQYMRLRSTASYVYFDIQNGSVETEISGTGSIEDYGNGWYRCSVIGNNTNSLAQIFLSDTEGGTPTGTGSALIYGAQFEAGNYVTSLIPTYGAAVTRGADDASKTGISSLIGQTEGTIFFEVDKTARTDNDCRVQISDGTTNNWIFVGVEVGNSIRAYVNVGGVNQFSVYGSVVTSGIHKVAMAYKANDFKVYVDGVAWITQTSGSVPACSKLNLGSAAPTTDASTDSKTSQAILFKTRLTNAQLAELTTL